MQNNSLKWQVAFYKHHLNKICFETGRKFPEYKPDFYLKDHNADVGISLQSTEENITDEFLKIK